MRRATRYQGEVPTGTVTADAAWRGFAARETAATAWAPEVEVIDAGRLHVDRRFGALLRQNGIATFEALFGARGGLAARLRNRGLNLTDRLEVVKNLLIRQAMN